MTCSPSEPFRNQLPAIEYESGNFISLLLLPERLFDPVVRFPTISSSRPKQELKLKGGQNAAIAHSVTTRSCQTTDRNLVTCLTRSLPLFHPSIPFQVSVLIYGLCLSTNSLANGFG